jgi:hypothetical protein
MTSYPHEMNALRYSADVKWTYLAYEKFASITLHERRRGA